MQRVITLPYTPRPQLRHVHDKLDAVEEAVLVLHRRCGKTVCLINHLIKKALQFSGGDSEFIYLAPYLKQAKRIAWKYLLKYTSTVPDRKISLTELSVTMPNGSRITLFGADNAEGMRGIFLDGCVLDEAAHISEDTYASILSPALMDRGGWVVFSGTPDGRRNLLFQKLQELKQNPEAYTFVLGASESGILTPDQLAKARVRCGTEEKYLREYENSFDVASGKRIYPEFHYGTHVSSTPLTPSEAVHIMRGWDNIGLAPAVVLTYLNVQQFRVFKEFIFHDTDIRDATEAVITWCQTNLHPRCTYSDYCDPAGKNRDSIKMSAKTYITIKARELGMDIRLQDGLQNPDIRWSSVRGRLSRIFNGEPAFLLDGVACPNLLAGFLGGYAFQEMVGNPGVFLKKANKTTGHSDGQDCIQYICTRVFITNEAVRSAEVSDDYYDEDDAFYQDRFDRRTGRNPSTGY